MARSLMCGHGFAGPEVRGGQDGADNDVRGEPQPPAAAGGDGDGVDHGGGGVHAAVGLHAERGRQPHGRVQLPGARRAAVLVHRRHHLGVGAVPDGHARPHADGAAAAAGVVDAAAAAAPEPAQLQAALAEAARPVALPQLFGQKLYDQSKLSAVQAVAGTKGSDGGALADTVNAATAAIASDPNFTAVLAAALTSYIGSRSGSGGAGAGGSSGTVQPLMSGGGDSCSRDDKIGEQNS